MKNWKVILAFLLIFSFRNFYSWRHSSFGQDIARDLILTKQKIEQGQVLVGYGPKASVGDFYLPPFYYQLQLLLSYLTNNFVWTMKWLVIVLESVTPILLYLCLKQLVSQKSATILAAVYTVSVLPTIFGSFAWNPNTIPFFTTLSLLGWLFYIKKNKKWPLVVSPLLAALSMQLHYQTVVLILFWLIVLGYMILKKRSDLKYLLLGVSLAVLSMTPYVFAEIKNDWQNTQAIVSYFTQEHARYYERVSKPQYVLSFLPAFVGRVISGKNHNFIWFGRVIFFLGGLGWLWLLTAKNRLEKSTQKLWFWLAIYFGSILIMLRVYKGDKIDYYLSTLYILPSFLLAAISQIAKKMKAFYYLFLALALVGVFWTGQYYAKLKPSNTLAAIKEIVYKLEQDLEKQQQQEVAILVHNDDHMNVIAYSLAEFSNLRIDQDSNYLAEIYQRWGWDAKKINRCLHSRQYTYANLLKTQAEYELLDYYQANQDFKLLLGKFDHKPEEIGYPLRTGRLDYGHDFIAPELYWY